MHRLCTGFTRSKDDLAAIEEILILYQHERDRLREMRLRERESAQDGTADDAAEYTGCLSDVRAERMIILLGMLLLAIGVVVVFISL